MVEMHLGKSENQGNTCVTVCQNLSSALDGVVNSLNEIGNYDIKGAAADSAKNFASSVAVPYINQAKNLLDTIKGDVKDLPAKYRSKVDSKSWSTDKLQSLINKCEIQAIAQSTAMGTVGAALAASGSSDAAKVLDKMQSNIDAVSRKKKKYKKLLKKLNDFNASSSSIFSDINSLDNALSQGSVAVSGNYSKGSYHKPKDLDWEKVGKGGDKDVYKAKKTKDKGFMEILKNIAGPLNKFTNSNNEDFRGFNRAFFKSIANDEERLKIINFGNKAEKVSSFIKHTKVAGLIGKYSKYTGIFTSFYKRIKKGEPLDVAVSKGIVSYVGQNLAGTAGRIGGRAVGGSIGVLFGGIVGTIVPGAGTIAGAEIGAEIGATIGGIAGDIYVSGSAGEKLNKDID